MSKNATDGKWFKRDWKPELLIHESNDTVLSSTAGLPRMLEIFINTPGAFKELRDCIPDRVSGSSEHPLKYAMILLAGFWLGYDCLDDLEKMQSDDVLVKVFGGIPCARSFGNFLRDFSEDNLKTFRSLLTEQALTYRRQLRRNSNIEFNIDSTDHIHHGDLIEGLEINYKGHWCLDSLEVFDELGFCYDFDLRSGATFSSVGAVEMMSAIMDKRPLMPSSRTDWTRADSAYCHEEYIKMCLLRRLKGTITAHGNIRWMESVSLIGTWEPWVFTKDEIEKSALTGRALPQVDLGYYMYSPGWADGKISFPVIIKRTFKSYEQIPRKKRAEMIKQNLNPRDGLHEYYAVLSLMGIHPRSLQEILEWHQKRANMENMIKEGKIGYDLRHFPCKKMKANHAYALFGMMAHNFFRFISILDNPRKPSFAKLSGTNSFSSPDASFAGRTNCFSKFPNVITRRWNH